MKLGFQPLGAELNLARLLAESADR